jgi:hypothetical protein
MTTAKHSAGIRSIAKVLGIATLAAALLGGAAQAKD